MATNNFTKEQFELNLPMANGKPLWEYVGLQKGEHCYLLSPYKESNLGIYIRSSIKASGNAANTGEDSIRAYIVKKPDLNYYGGKIQKYITRVTGWESRLTELLRRLTNQIRWCQACPKCGHQLVPFVSNHGKKENIGRCFVTCMQKELCSFFEFTESKTGELLIPNLGTKGVKPIVQEKKEIITIEHLSNSVKKLISFMEFSKNRTQDWLTGEPVKEVKEIIKNFK